MRIVAKAVAHFGREVREGGLRSIERVESLLIVGCVRQIFIGTRKVRDMSDDAGPLILFKDRVNITLSLMRLFVMTSSPQSRVTGTRLRVNMSEAP